MLEEYTIKQCNTTTLHPQQSFQAMSGEEYYNYNQGATQLHEHHLRLPAPLHKEKVDAVTQSSSLISTDTPLLQWRSTTLQERNLMLNTPEPSSTFPSPGTWNLEPGTSNIHCK